MKQMSFLHDISQTPVVPEPLLVVTWKLFIDGASRKNPGNAGAGVYLMKNDEIVFRKGFFLGCKTNNQAEYLALLLGIFYAKKHVQSKDLLTIFSDSELLVKHMKGEYKIRNAELKLLFDFAFVLLDGLHYSFCHVLREYNVHADALANEGIDKKIKIPQEFFTLLHAHGIQI